MNTIEISVTFYLPTYMLYILKLIKITIVDNTIFVYVNLNSFNMHKLTKVIIVISLILP